MPVSGYVAFDLNLTDSRTRELGVITPVNLVRTYRWSVVNGVGADQADLFAFDERTLAGAANENLDFVGGNVTDGFGVTINFVKLKLIWFIAATTNTTVLTISRPTGTTGVPFIDAALDSFQLGPGDMDGFTRRSLAGIPVAAGSDFINVVNAAGAAASYTYIALGTSA